MSEIRSTKIIKLIECSICKKNFVDPRALPCIHTFCLECIEQHGAGKKPGDQVPCPICQKVFTVPGGGFENLQQNFFIQHLVENSKSGYQLEKGDVFCDGCKNNETNVTSKGVKATKYCTGCKQGLCDNCLNDDKHGKSHKIVPIEEVQDTMKSSLSPNYCKLHSREQLKYYCYDCKIIICVTCFVEQHKSHKCSDFTNVVDDLRQQMEKNVERMEEKIESETEKFQRIQLGMEQFKEHVSDKKLEIQNRLESMKMCLGEHAHNLCEELDSTHRSIIAEVAEIQEDSKNALNIMKDFLIYYKEVQARASACDLACSARDLHTRTSELMKYNSKWNPNILTKFEFRPVKVEDLVDDKRRNLIGEIQRGTTEHENASGEHRNPVFVPARNILANLIGNWFELIRKKPKWFLVYMLIIGLAFIHFGISIHNMRMHLLAEREFNALLLIEHKIELRKEIETTELKIKTEIEMEKRRIIEAEREFNALLLIEHKIELKKGN